MIALLLSACGEPDGAIATQSTSTNELVVTVTEITTDFGNINTDLERLKAADAGLVPGAQFRLSFGARMVYGLFATTYEDVAEGEWVAILTEDDNVQFARSFDNAATALKVQVGSKLRVRASGTQ